MDQELFFNGIKYISSKRASEISGFAKDYIGELCRKEKLRSRRVGRSWYIEEFSLLEYLKSENRKIHKGHKFLTDEELSAAAPIPSEIKQEDLSPALVGPVVPTAEATVYEEEKTEEDAPVPSATLSPFFASFYRSLVASSIAATMIFVALLGYVTWSQTSTLTTIYNSPVETERSLADASRLSRTLDAVALGWYKTVSGVWARTTDEIARAIALFRSDDSSKGIIATRDASSREGDPAGGIVVVPESGSDEENHEVINRIKQSFSDEVHVVIDESGTSGIITPVFQERTDDKYLYVMVPVKN